MKFKNPLSVCSALFLISVGTYAQLGSFLRNFAAVQLPAAWKPMSFDTAIGFTLLGISIAFLSFRRREVPVFTFLLICLGGSTLFGYLLNIDFGIGQIFFTATATSHLERMAPKTALCFVLFGIALTALAAPQGKNPKHQLALAVSALFLFFMITFAAFFVWLAGLPGTYIWWPFTRMASDTAFYFVIGGIGIGRMLLAELSSQQTYSVRTLSPVIAGLGSLGISVTSWQVFAGVLTSNELKLVGEVHRRVATAIEHALSDKLATLNRLAVRWDTRTPTSPEWNVDVRNYLADIEIFDELRVVDAKGDTFVFAGAPYLETKVPHQQARLPPEITRMFSDLPTKQGAIFSGEQLGPASLLWVYPSIGTSNTRVYLLAFISPSAQLSRLLNERHFSAVSLLNERNELIFSSAPSIAPLNYTQRLEEIISVLGHNWKLVVTPQLTAHPSFSRFPLFLLLVGILFSGIIAQLTRLYFLSQSARKSEAENKKKVELMIENAPIAILLVNEWGRIEHINHATSKILGFSPKELVGEPIEILVPDAIKPAHVALRDSYFKDPNIRTLRARTSVLCGKHKNGTLIPLEILLSPIETNGQTSALAFAKDLSAEEDRKRIFELCPDFLCTATPDGRFKEINSAFTKTLGWSQEELLASSFLDFIHPDDIESTLLEMQKLNSGLETIDFENRYRCKNGEYRNLSWNAIHFGGVYYASARDITDQKVYLKLRLSEQKLRSSLEELHRSNVELEQFAYVASHDLQAPLRHIASFSALLAKRIEVNQDPEIHKWFGFITQAVGKMEALIQDLLSFSKVKKESVEFETLDLNSALREVLDTLALDPSTTTVETASLPTVKGLASPIRQLLQNLVQNAAKYRRPDAACTIKISSQEKKDHWVISVADNGIGIEKEYFQKIFQLFQRLHKQEEYSGTGIGLAICKKVVALHGGSIWVESASGRGSTFFFSIPKDPAKELSNDTETGAARSNIGR